MLVVSCRTVSGCAVVSKAPGKRVEPMVNGPMSPVSVDFLSMPSTGDGAETRSVFPSMPQSARLAAEFWIGSPWLTARLAAGMFSIEMTAKSRR